MKKIHYTYHNQEKHFTSFIRRCTFHLGNKSYFLKLKLNQNKLKKCPNSIEKNMDLLYGTSTTYRQNIKEN